MSGEEDPAALEFTEEQKALIIKTIAENGCEIDEEGAQRLMPPLGIDTMIFSTVVSQLMADGLATMSLETEKLTLAPELCP
ncbi:MAG: hypothetical protein MUE52_18645 [Tabrizicola sp.]|nr:hypothetical protein [Tabrizicola sp.]